MLVLGAVTGCKPPPPPGPPPLRLSVRTTPPGATVTTTGVTLGQTPLAVAIPHGPRLLELTLTGHETTWLRIPGDAQNACALETPLQPLKAAVLVESEPSDASLTLNGEDKGKTPVLIAQLAVGTYDAELSAAGYAPRKFRLIVDNARPRRVRQQLNSVIGSLEVWTTPGGVDVYLGEKLAGTTPDQGEPVLVLKDMTAGEYALTVRRAGFKPLAQTAMVKPKQRAIVKFTALQALPGSLLINSTPAAAEVLNGEGRLLGVTPLALKDLPLGLFTCSVRKTDHADEVKSIEILPGASQTLEVTLRKITGAVELVTEPPGVTVTLDGQVVGKTAPGENPKASRLFVHEGLTPGAHALELRHPDYDVLTLKFKVDQGQTASLGPQVLKKRWLPTHRLRLVNGNTYEGVLINQAKDGSITFENAPKQKSGYKKDEIESVETIRSPAPHR